MKKIETSTKGSNGNPYERIEIVWMNKYFVKALESGRIPIRLTKKEKHKEKLILE